MSLRYLNEFPNLPTVVPGNDTGGGGGGRPTSGVIASNGAHGTITFSYTGSTQTWVVPVGVFVVDVELVGAAGGMGDTPVNYQAWGGQITGTMGVIAGETLNIEVGELGKSAYPATISGAYNGGGPGGYAWSTGRFGGSGGGGSDVRCTPYTLADRLACAGGGGGEAGSYGAQYGGHSNRDGSVGGATGGEGGIGEDGGTSLNGHNPSNGEAGTAGTLGVGGTGYNSNNIAAGGGGGGYYGGGGGGCDSISAGNSGGGGGGSSNRDDLFNTTSHTYHFQDNDDGYVTFTW